MDSEHLALVAAAWLLTYGVHSTVLLGGAFVFERALRRRSEAILETVWRAALFGPLLTTTLQLVGVQQFAWRLELASGAAGAAGSTGLIGGFLREGNPSGVPLGAIAIAGLSVYLAVVCFQLGRLILTRYALGRLLRDRRVLSDPRLAERARRFSGGRFVKISASAAISTPIVVGRGELCLPWRVLRALSPDELDAVLAHEIAHLRRSDGAWLWAMLLVERIFWIQPLNRAAVARLHTLAECFCDDWALRRAVPPVALASALARVAEWMRPGPVNSVGVGMASRESLALRRVRRILDIERTPASERGRLIAVMVAAAMLCGITVVAPGFAAAAVASQTITAYDDGGRFTVTLRGGDVIGMTMDGIPVDPERIHRQAGRVIVDAAGVNDRLELTLRPGGGFSWTSRPPRPARPIPQQ